MNEIIKQENVGKYFVSTIRLGKVYETCVFNDNIERFGASEVVQQYDTETEARAGHEATVATIRFIKEI